MRSLARTFLLATFAVAMASGCSYDAGPTAGQAAVETCETIRANGPKVPTTVPTGANTDDAKVLTVIHYILDNRACYPGELVASAAATLDLYRASR